MAVVTEKEQSKIRPPYITTEERVCNGKPVIAGTRIKVDQIALEYDRMGWSADEIVQAHPHLTLAHVHAALAFYYENADSINAAIQENEQAVAAIRRGHPHSLLDP